MKIFKLFTFLSVILAFLCLSSCKNDIDVSTLLTNPSNPVVRMKTNMGDIFIELYQNESPITVENFLNYVDSDFYNGTIFHRVINGFMIQGGGLLPGLEKKEPYDPIKNEADNGLSNLKGTISMARTKLIHSATSQFFINVNDNTSLDYKTPNPREFGYAVFGRVIEGMDVVDLIKETKTTTVQPYNDVPIEDIIIKKVILIKK